MPLKVKAIGMKNTFYDFWRSIKDYKNFIDDSNFMITDIKEPMASKNSKILWKDETKQAPVIIITSKKIKKTPKSL